MRLVKLFFTLIITLTVTTGYASTIPAVEKSQVIVFINGMKFYVHTVKAGDTLFSIAGEYNTTVDIIKQNNPNAADGIKIDQTIKIPVSEKEKAAKKRKKDFITHKVKAGETLYAIARLYDISVETLRDDNPDINPQELSIGQSLWIRRTDIGQSSEQEAQQELQEYADNLNKVEDDDAYIYHVVQAGETIYSLSRQYGITEEEFATLNDVAMGLKAGSMIRVPKPQAEEEVITEQEGGVTLKEGENVVFRALASEQKLNIALMLPLSVSNRANANYVEFYQGFLLGLEELKERGCSETSLTLYNTAHDSVRIDSIVSSQLFEGTNLIVGPVYEDELQPVLKYAVQNAVPVVSPLATIDSVHSPVLYQLAPEPTKKYDKIESLIDGNKEICLIYAASNDTEFEQEILARLEGKSYNAYTYTFNKESIFTPRTASTRRLEETIDILNTDKDILFIVFANRETDVDRILGTFASVKVSNTERSIKVAEYEVLGSSRWSRFNNIDNTTFFNNNVMMVSTYHAKRDNAAVRVFDSRYIRSYKTLPSLYAYRGYDAAIIFGQGMRGDIDYNMLDKRYTPLQTTYKFGQAAAGERYINQEWMLIKYNNNYTITLQ